MADLKTKQTDDSVEAFLDQVDDDQKRKDIDAVVELMKQATKAEPKLWGSSIVGFGQYHYKYPSGREGDWALTGFSPRKQALTLYITGGFDEYEGLLAKLGKYKMGKACIYVKRLDDLHLPTLKKLIQLSVKHVAKTHAASKR